MSELNERVEPLEPVEPVEPHEATELPEPTASTELETRRSRRLAREQQEQREPITVGTRLLAMVKEVFVVVTLAVGLSLVVKTFLIQPFHIPSGSMEDTLIKDDRVVVGKLTPGPIALQRGDVVVFADPGN